MTKLLLHANQFTERGDSVTLMTVAEGLRSELNIESVIAFPKWAKANNPVRIDEARRSGLELFEYSSRLELELFAKALRLTHNYVISDGSLAGISYSEGEPERFRLGNLRHLTQAVFRRFEPHGDAYAYISEWLYNWSQTSDAKFISGPLYRHRGEKLKGELAAPKVNWVPHIVKPEEGDGLTFRRRNRVPQNAKVIGRIGGFDEFSDVAAQQGLIASLEANSNYYAILVNTRKFTSHARVIHCDYLSRDEVWDFYDACDLLINGRRMGESFGFSVVEPLSLGKPVIAPHPIRNLRMDKHHVQLLGTSGLLYKNSKHLTRLIDSELSLPSDPLTLKAKVAPFSQSNVMERFRSVYLSE